MDFGSTGPNESGAYVAPEAPQPGPKSVQPYSPRATFGEGDPIGHPSFGRGEVVKVRGKKITVAFASGSKTLAHAL